MTADPVNLDDSGGNMYGLTFSDGEGNACQTGYVYPTVRAAADAAIAMLDDPTRTAIAVEWWGIPPVSATLTAALVETEDYTVAEVYLDRFGFWRVEHWGDAE